MVFSNNKNENIGGQQKEIFVIFVLTDTAVFMYKAAIHIILFSKRILFTNVTLPYMSHIIGVVLNCSL